MTGGGGGGSAAGCGVDSWAGGTAEDDSPATRGSSGLRGFNLGGRGGRGAGSGGGDDGTCGGGDRGVPFGPAGALTSGASLSKGSRRGKVSGTSAGTDRRVPQDGQRTV